MRKIDSIFKIVVCDAGPLIHLDELNCLDLLNDFNQVIVPTTVWQEVEIHRPSALTCSSVFLERIPVVLNDNPETQAMINLFLLHQGEIEALQIVRQFSKALLLTDDTAARLAAQHLSISAHGTIGVLVRSIRRKKRTKAQIIDILRLMPNKSSLFIKKSFLKEIVRQVEEESDLDK